MSIATTHDQRKHKFSGKRYPCPVCGSKHGFARADGKTDTGKCHSCGKWVEPKSNESLLHDDTILLTKQGTAINTRPYQKRQQQSHPFDTS
jgi:phage/plasmid primase-like uncharacterized protein